MEIWEHKPPGTLWGTPDLLREPLTFTFVILYYHCFNDILLSGGWQHVCRRTSTVTNGIPLLTAVKRGKRSHAEGIHTQHVLRGPPWHEGRADNTGSAHLMQLQIIVGNGGLNIVDNCKIFTNLFIFCGARGGTVG